jgi:hypothetical protein
MKTMEIKKQPKKLGRDFIQKLKARKAKKLEDSEMIKK